MILGKDNVERLPPPVGTSDWARFSLTSYCVDKTLIVKELIDSDSTVVLFTRPRRFGKTTMLRMLRAFYDGDATLFHDKKIWAAGEQYRAEQGQHPVIFLSFKDVKPRRGPHRHRQDRPRLLQEQRRALRGGLGLR